MIKLAILWHMHQPFYEDLATGEHILPWVRLHAVKDYYGMVALLEEFPGVHLTFNLVPSLLVQVQAFADGRAKDRHLEIGLKPAGALDPDERAFLVANGFHAPYDRMIRPVPRYAALHARRHAAETFTEQDLRDLQVWHKLVWMDPDWLQRDPRLTELVKKGSLFTENDKAILRTIELELLGRVIPAYRAAAARGQVELSTSPFYHPILPLLCDTDVHLRAYPHSTIPRGLFRQPADAREQLHRAVRLHTSLFGAAPRGVWPSEGAVSGEAVRLIAETGCAWTATDEGILARSLNQAVSAETLYRPYEVGEQGRALRCLFRDHGLSDLIGFSYQSWDAEAAAEDFVRRVQEAGRRFDAAGGREEPVICVILDGENAWEHYPGGGRPFLRALYGRLERARDIRTVSMSEAAAGPARRLESVFPGSWINADLYIWAGHPDDHRAWAQLAAARQAFDDLSHTVAPDNRAIAFEELLIAEGSDWFWWYGDDHSSDHDRDFDELFRRHLRNVYRALGADVQDQLFVSNITTGAPTGPIEPRVYIEPVLDGEVTGFGEWAGAVPIALGTGGGTMHRVSSDLVSHIAVGVGRSDVFVRIEGPTLVRGLAARQYGIGFLIGESRLPGAAFRIATGSVIEVALSVDQLGPTRPDRVSVAVLITDAAGHVIERHPSGHPIDLQLPAGDLDLLNWVV